MQPLAHISEPLLQSQPELLDDEVLVTPEDVVEDVLPQIK